MARSAELKLCFYGDDITGSTDAMEALVLAGVPTVLFLEPPTLARIKADFPHIQAVGLAGMSRTMTPVEMDAALPGAFSSLKALGAPVMHYKVCSTFDSSPSVGSIGRAAEIGMELFGSGPVPVAVGAPRLKRCVVGGTLFAAMGDITYRIDRHPVMSKHPVTPMDESDLRIHLGRQTGKKIGLLDFRHLAAPHADVDAFLQKLVAEGVEIVILDTLDSSHLKNIGRLLWSLGKKGQAFVVGSSGVEFALSEFWQEQKMIRAPRGFGSPGKVEKIVAISGSASPWTAVQIKWALDNGFHGIQMDGVPLVDKSLQDRERGRLVAEAVQFSRQGRSVLLYSALGPDDPKINQTREHLGSLGRPPGEAGAILGTQQGLLLRDILAKTGLRRVAVAGGDTCGYVLRQLSIDVLEFIVPLGTASPLCRARSSDPNFDRIEIALKGGQLGEVDFFGSVRKGRQG